MKKKFVPYLFPFFIENNKAIVMKHHLKFYKPVGTYLNLKSNIREKFLPF